MGKWGASGEPLDDDARAQVGEEATGTEDAPEGKGPADLPQPNIAGAELGAFSGRGRFADQPYGGETREGEARLVELDANGQPVEYIAEHQHVDGEAIDPDGVPLAPGQSGVDTTEHSDVVTEHVSDDPHAGALVNGDPVDEAGRVLDDGDDNA